MAKNGRRGKLHQQFMIDRLLLDLDKFHPQFFGECPQNVVLFDNPHLDENSVNSLTPRLGQCRFHLRPGNQIMPYQSLSDIHSGMLTIVRDKDSNQVTLEAGYRRVIY